MKKALSLLLAFVMVFSMIPLTAFAADAPSVTFETDFSNDLGVGDTFTVTASLANNPGLSTVTLSLKWNENAVAFNGFATEYDEDNEEDVLVSNVLGAFTAVYNQELGIISAGRAKNSTKTGVLFVANFEIVANSGNLDIGLKTDSDEEYQLWNVDNEAIGAIIDDSAISGLTIGGKAVGPEMPEDAPFTAITTDAGPIVAVEYVEDVEFNNSNVPYYIVTLPADAETAYVTAPDQVVMEDWTTGAMQATGYAADLEDMSALYISYSYEEVSDGIKVEIPMEMTSSDWSGNEINLCFFSNDEYNPATHAFGIEDAGYACLGLISFVYDDVSADAPAYNIASYTSAGGSVVALNEEYEEITEAKEGDLIYLDVIAEDGYTAKRWGYTFDGNSYDCENGCFNMPAGDVELFAVFEKQHTVVGYRFATSADVTADNGENVVVHVKITGHSNPEIKNYNAYDLTLTFDDTKLEYVDYAGAVKSDNGSVTVEGNTIRIVGCGATKNFDTEIAALTFTTKDEGAANVTISKVQVSDKEESVKEDAPEATAEHAKDDTTADETPDVSVVIVPYSVTKPDFISGNDKIPHGEDYTFSYTDTDNYTYKDLTVKVGGTVVTPGEADGVYTILGVTGAIEITATQTPNSYDVTKPENVEGPDKATYGVDYIFTVTPAEGMKVADVTVTDANGKEISYTINDENGEYVIEGTDITGAFIITVTETEKDTTITFTGIEATEIEGGKLIMTAEIGKDFIFRLNKEAGYDYTIMVGEKELTESEENAGQYTIPAELVVKEGVQVNITKTDNTKPVVDVTEYISLDGNVMFLITAKWRDKVLAYGEDTMFWSDKYTVTGEQEAGAYCWLVVSNDNMNTVELVKAAAEAAIKEASEGTTATAVKYNYDVNGTTKVDVNDAQLAYDMYNASYMEFNDNLPMLKFLEADVDTNAKLDTKDVAAIISYIVSGAAN